MNGLYGYPMSGVNRLSALAQSAAIPSVGITTMNQILNGEMHKQLKKMRTEQMEANAQIQSVKLEINKLPESSAKANALGLWEKAFAANRERDALVQQAVAKYNQIVNLIQTSSFNTVAPPSLGNLGVAPVALIVGGVVSVALLMALAGLIEAIKSKGGEYRGYIDQIGDTIGKTGMAIQRTALSTGALIAIAVGAWALYMILSKRHQSSGSTALATVPHTIDVEGRVVG